jgi:hypothetical protein
MTLIFLLISPIAKLKYRRNPTLEEYGTRVPEEEIIDEIDSGLDGEVGGQWRLGLLETGFISKRNFALAFIVVFILKITECILCIASVNERQGRY